MAEEYTNLGENSQLYTLDTSHLLAIVEALGLEKPKDLEYETFGDLILKHMWIGIEKITLIRRAVQVHLF